MATTRFSNCLRFGTFFWTVLAVFAMCAIVIPSLSALTLAGQLESAGDKIQGNIQSVVSASMHRHKEIRPSNSLLSEAADSIDYDGLVGAISQGEASPADIATFEERLASTGSFINKSPSDVNTVSYFFVEQKLLVSSSEDLDEALVQETVATLVERDMKPEERVTRIDGTEGRKVTMYYRLSDNTFMIVNTQSQAEELRELVAQLKSIDEDVEVAFYDAFGTVECQTGNAAACMQVSYEDFEVVDETTARALDFDGIPYTCTYINYSDSHTVMAVYAVDRASLAHRNATMVGVVGVFGSAILFLLIIGYFLRRVYLPVQKIALHFQKPVGEEPFDEIKAIDRGVSALEQKAKTQDDVVKRARLLQTLQGRPWPFEDEHVDGKRRFPFVEGHRSVLIAIKEEFSEECSGSSSVEDWIVSIRKAFLAEGFTEVETLHDGMFVLLLAGVPEKGAGRIPRMKNIVRLCDAVAKRAATSSNLAFSFFISDFFPCPQGLAVGYDQVQRISSHCLATERYNVVLDFPHMHATLGGDTHLDMIRMREFLEAMRCASKDRALDAFDAMAAPLGSLSLTMDKANPAVVNLLNVVRLGLSYASTTDSQQQDVDKRAACQLPACTTVEDMRRLVSDTLALLREGEASNSLNPSRFADVERFVLQNVSDQNFSGQSVIAEFGISQSSLTHMFKQNAGKGFLAYVHGVRIERAMEILTSTDLSVEAVASRVGFGNALTMTRVFKKYVGTTPGAYRSQHR